MGYTHYYELSCGAALDKQTVTEIKRLCEKTGIPLGSGFYDDSSRPPLFSSDCIAFNGVDEDAHEDFCVDFSRPFSDFCKTARKPYDLAVCITLLVLAMKVPNFRFTSDGFDNKWRDDQWNTAIDFLEAEGYSRDLLESFLR